MKRTDIIVIGAGMAGLTSAIYLKRANANFILLEGLLPGGLLNSLKDIENYPGFPKTSGKDIMVSLMNQVRSLGIEITYGNVQSVLKDPYGFKVVADSDIYLTKAVIVASGYRIDSEPLKGEKEYLGRGVSYCATCDGNFFKDQDVAIYGSGESAKEEALYLSNIVRTLYFVSESLPNELKKENVKFIKSSIVEICGDDFGVNKIKLKNNEEIPCYGVFVYQGKKLASEFLNNIKPSMNNNFIISDDEMMSDIPGLFVAGDVRNKVLRQLITAANDGAIAAISANKYIRNLK